MGERGGGGEERWEKGMTPPSDTNIITYIIYKSYCINIPLINIKPLKKGDKPHKINKGGIPGREEGDKI